MEFPIKVLIIIVLAVITFLVFVAVITGLGGKSILTLDTLFGFFKEAAPEGEEKEGNPSSIPSMVGGTPPERPAGGDVS